MLMLLNAIYLVDTMTRNRSFRSIGSIVVTFSIIVPVVLVVGVGFALYLFIQNGGIDAIHDIPRLPP